MFATKTPKTATVLPAPNTGLAAPENVSVALAALVAQLTPAQPAKAVRGALVACACARFVTEDGKTTGGCTATTKRLFAPGHDAKLKGLLLRAGVAGLTVTDAQGDTTRTAVETAELFGFAGLVREGLDKNAAKTAAKAAAKTEREAAKAAAPAPTTAAPARPMAEAVQAEEAAFAALLAEVAEEEAATRRAQQAEQDAAWEEASPAETAEVTPAPAPAKRARRARNSK